MADASLYFFPFASSDPVASMAMCAHAWSQVGGGNARPASANEVTARCRASARWVRRGCGAAGLGS